MRCNLRIRRVLCSLLVLWCVLPAGMEALEIGVSPTRFEIVLGEQPVTEALRVFNVATRPVTIQIRVHHWTLDANNDVQLIEPNEQSLDQWILINPSRFTIPVGEAQTVRFAIRPRVQPTPGEHRAMLYFEEVSAEEPNVRGVQTLGRLGVAVYAYAGEVQRRGTLHGVEVLPSAEPLTVAFDMASEGNVHIRLQGQYAVWQAERYPGAQHTRPLEHLGTDDLKLPEGMVEAGFLPALPVLPGTRRQIKLPLQTALPPGAYVLDIKGEIGGLPINQWYSFRMKERPRASSPQGSSAR